MNSLEAAFLTNPRFEDISEGAETQKLRLLGDLKVFSAKLNAFMLVPEGFEFEESIPSVLFSVSRPRGESKRAACVHDWLYRHGSYMTLGGQRVAVTRKEADAVYHELLRLKGVSPIRAYFRWLGVRLGGRGSFKPID